MIFPKPYADFVQRLRVPSGLFLALAFIWLAEPRTDTMLTGLPLCVAGLWLRSWAAGHLRKNQTLTESGPYAWVRNPLYLGTLAVVAGCAAAAARLSLAVLAAALFVLIYLPVIEQEQQHLAKLFPGYAEYARRVPLFVPRGRRIQTGVRYSWAVWQMNKEWKAWGGFALVAALLLAKAYLFL